MTPLISMSARLGSSMYALYPLRIGLAVVFVYFGWNKLTDVEGTSAFFAAEGIPLATAATVLVAIAEFFGGLAILVGVLTRFSAAVLSVVMLTAIIFVQWSSGFVGGWNLDFVLLMGLVTLLVNGPGRPTLGSVLAEWRSRADRNVESVGA